MASDRLNTVDKAKECLSHNKNFLVKGGAGSGKTETLKELLNYMNKEHPYVDILCITHTNIAVKEIKERIGAKYEVSTIHSFISKLIKDYKKNIKTVIHELFLLELMIRDVQGDTVENVYKKEQHEKYKKVYEKYTRKLHSYKKEFASKVVGKRDYDNNPEEYNNKINNKIDSLNSYVREKIQNTPYKIIKYNLTKFNNISDLSYGHDGLLQIYILLLKKYPNLQKIINDKYDYIFIDEFQDTHPEIVKGCCEISQRFDEFRIALFGDSMQAIYEGDVDYIDELIKEGKIENIDKTDNYRSSEQVKDFINTLRGDIQQEIAFKKNIDGKFETIEDRQGTFSFYYTKSKKRPHSRSSLEDKLSHSQKLDKLVEVGKESFDDAKILMLTNKAVAKKCGFEMLYQIFDNRYSEVKDQIENILARLSVDLIYCLYDSYKQEKYNYVITSIKESGLNIKSIEDKAKIKELFDHLISMDGSLVETIDYCIENKIIKVSEQYQKFISKAESDLQVFNDNKRYYEIGNFYLELNTFNKIKDTVEGITEEEFKDFEYSYRVKIFLDHLLSKKLKFSEVVNYYNYLDERTEYVTMHKTKGQGLKNVIVVLDEYFWKSEYDFSNFYSNENNGKRTTLNAKKLVYVACSRAIENLVCVAVVEDDAVKGFKEKYPFAIEITGDSG